MKTGVCARVLRGCLMLGLVGALAGCETVEPWQRGHLAKPQMQDGDAVLRSARDHAYSAREASSGGASAQGGGCGCY